MTLLIEIVGLALGLLGGGASTALADAIARLLARRTDVGESGHRASESQDEARTPDTSRGGFVVELPFPRTTYSVASAVFTTVLLAATAIMIVVGGPSDDTANSFNEFFSSSAQVLVGLLIAVAIELRANGILAASGQPRLEAVLALIWITLGQACAVLVLLPDSPDVFVTAALAIVPASIVGALVAFFALAIAPRRSRPASDDGP